MNAADARKNMLQATNSLYLVALRNYIEQAILDASKGGAFAIENPWKDTPLSGNQVAIERVLDSLKADGFGVSYLSDQTNPAEPIRAVVDWQIRKETGTMGEMVRFA
jgi:hypothetical protein